MSSQSRSDAIAELEVNLGMIRIYEDPEGVQQKAMQAIQEAKNNLSLGSHSAQTGGRAISTSVVAKNLSEEELLRMSRPYLKYLQYEISTEHHLPILLTIYHLSEKMMEASVEISGFLGEASKMNYLNTMAQWTNLINTEARKLFSDGIRLCNIFPLLFIFNLSLRIMIFGLNLDDFFDYFVSALK